MEIVETINWLGNYHKGTYTHAEWETITENGYTKVSNGVVRILGGVSISKNGIAYIRLFTTKNHLNKAHVRYYNQFGEEISKEEFELANPTKPSTITICFTKHLDDVIRLGK